MLKLDKSQKRKLAVEWEVDPRSLEKLLRGEEVRGMAGHRARAALHSVGIELAQNDSEEREP
jgi:hypothetical protein